MRYPPTNDICRRAARGRARAVRGGSLPALVAALLCPSIAQAIPLISEVLYDASGSDDGRTFVEIAGVPGTSLDGFTLEGVNGSNGAVGPVIALSGVIPLDGLFVVADATSGGTTEVSEVDLIADFDFQNGPDSIVLTDGAVAVDALGYGVFDPGEVFAGEGMPAEDPSAGWSLARRFADVDTDDNAADFIAQAVPTPGVAAFQSVPEPGTAVLAGTGLATLAFIRRGHARRRPSA